MFVLYPTESTAAGLRLADPGFSGPPPGCLHTNKAASKSGREHALADFFAFTQYFRPVVLDILTAHMGDKRHILRLMVEYKRHILRLF
jgi:hypothetical protein